MRIPGIPLAREMSRQRDEALSHRGSPGPWLPMARMALKRLREELAQGVSA